MHHKVEDILQSTSQQRAQSSQPTGETNIAPETTVSHVGQHSTSTGPFTNNDRSYPAAVSPTNYTYDGRYMTLGGDRRLITGDSYGRHGEDVADRNIDQYSISVNDGRMKPLPALPSMCS